MQYIHTNNYYYTIDHIGHPRHMNTSKYRKLGVAEMLSTIHRCPDCRKFVVGSQETIRYRELGEVSLYSVYIFVL